MRSLAGCPLSQPQFATLAVLVQLNLDDDGGGSGRDGGDASGGTPPPRRRLRRAVLRESTTVITPLTHLPERSARGAVEGLCGRLMGRAGMRDDFDDDGNDDRAGGEDKENAEGGGNPAEAPQDRGDGDEGGDDEKSPRVRFDSGTKGPSTPSSEPPSRPAEEVPSKPKVVRVGTYTPPRHVAPGLTVHHAALRVDDLRAALEEEKEGDGESYRSRALRALRSASSALLPGTDLPSLVSEGPAQPCLVVLAVGTAGPSCDLHGSPFLASLPGRIREFLDVLSSPDLPGDAGSGRLRLVRAVMAGVLDDGSGIMIDHDSLGSAESSKRDTAALGGKVTDSTTGLLASRRGLPTSTGSVRSATPRGSGRFTFTMRRGASRRDGPAPSSLPDDGDGGDGAAANNPAGDGGEDGEGHDHAVAARESAARLELLSLAVPDMGLGKYESAGRRPGSPRRRGGPGTPRGGGGFGAPSGRFGRPPAPRSDLSGFEYRPPPGHGGVPGAVPPAPSSDDISTSGETSAYSVGSVSSQVPKLTRSRRDTGGAGTGGSSRSRFLARKRKSPRASSSAGTAGGMGPIDESGPSPSHSVRTSGSVQTEWFRSADEPPQHQRQEETYDPVGTDDGERVGETPRSAASSAPVGTPSPGGGGEPPRGGARWAGTPSWVGSADSASAVLTLSPLPTRSADGDGSLPAPPASPVAEEPAGSVAESSAASVATETAGDEEEEGDEFAGVPPASPLRPADEGGVGGVDGPPSPPPARIGVSVALNEDLTCEYRGSRLSSLSVEGTVQVRVSGTPSPSDDGGGEEQGGDGGDGRPGPFGLLFRDPSGHIRALQENKKYVSGSPGGPDVSGRVFAYSVDVPRGGEYFPVVRYKCSSSLRPVPVRVQSRIRTQGNLVRVALQVSSNPRNPSDLSHLSITMSVPGGVRGETLQCSPAGGVWDGAGRTVHWRVSGLGPGEKFQLQSVFESDGGDGDEGEGAGADAAGLEFPVLARCQCQGAQLSDVDVDAAPSPLFPAEVSRDLVRRFRVSHRETQADTA